VTQLVRTALACRFLRVKTRVNLIIFQIFNPCHFIAVRKLVSICIIFKSKKKYSKNYATKYGIKYATKSIHAPTYPARPGSTQSKPAPAHAKKRCYRA